MTTTFEGKPLSFNGLKHVVNKEPTLGADKEVVEKMYRAHRERVLDQGTVLDTHVHIPEFMKNQVWRKISKNRKDKLLAVNNEHMYERLQKAENKMSKYTADNIRHLELTGSMSKCMTTLRTTARLRKNVQIQRENEYLMIRLNKARPVSTAKDISDWYKHHIVFKEGRRSDPTAGHIMTGIYKDMPFFLHHTLDAPTNITPSDLSPHSLTIIPTYDLSPQASVDCCHHHFHPCPSPPLYSTNALPPAATRQPTTSIWTVAVRLIDRWMVVASTVGVSLVTHLH